MMDRWIVVPLDGRLRSEGAVSTASALARKMGIGVRLLTVVEDPAAESERYDYLTRLAARADGVPTRVTSRVGVDVAAEVLSIVKDTDIVCMATAGSIRPHAGHVGSIAEVVVRELGRPVVLIGPHADPSLDVDQVVVPLDGSRRAEAGLEVAAEWARFLDLPLWVVSVVTPSIEQAASAVLEVEGTVAESAYVGRQARKLEALGIDAQFEVLHGENPAESILDFAQSGSLVVMSTHGRSGLGRLLFGSVAASVVADARHPVVVLRPPAHDLVHEPDPALT